MVDLLDERNDVAANPATKTMIEVSRRCYLERGRLLVMEWTEPFQAAATGTLQLQVLADDLVDLRALTHERDVGGPDPPRWRHQLLPPMTAAVAPPAAAAEFRRLITSSSQ